MLYRTLISVWQISGQKLLIIFLKCSFFVDLEPKLTDSYNFEELCGILSYFDGLTVGSSFLLYLYCQKRLPGSIIEINYFLTPVKVYMKTKRFLIES